MYGGTSKGLTKVHCEIILCVTVINGHFILNLLNNYRQRQVIQDVCHLKKCNGMSNSYGMFFLFHLAF